MTRLVSWVIAIGILVLAGVVVALEPPEQAEQGPFVVDVAQDALGVGRNIEATISNVRLANVVELDEIDGWRGETEGVWVVADVTAATRANPTGLSSFLLIDDLEFRGSDRMGTDGIESWILATGIPTTGTVLFEIPLELAERTTAARVMVGTSGDWRLDSVISTTVDLSALAVDSTAVVAPTARRAP
jgi:hypothetical protein